MKSTTAALAASSLMAAFSLAAAPVQAQTEAPKHGGTLRFVMKYEPSTLSSVNNTSTPLTSGMVKSRQMSE